MEFLNGLSDDQTALAGCAAALFVCGAIMSLSYYVGRFFHKAQVTPEQHEPQTLKLPDPLSLPAKTLGSVSVTKADADRPRRRAA